MIPHSGSRYTSDPDSKTFGASVDLVLEEIRNIKGLHRSVRRAKLLQFATDTCLVAHGVRTGYLVDAVNPLNPMQTLTTLLTVLRGKSSLFKNVVLWHHTPTAQSFLVHTFLLQERLAGLLAGAGGCVFIKLDRCLSVVSRLREPPDRLRKAIHDVRSSMAEFTDVLSFSLSDAFTQEILIPLAAIMIDYPVAYCPACSAQTSFLEGEGLDIYTVSLQRSTTSDSTLNPDKEHVLLKFSCPRVLISNCTELSPGTVIEKLSVKFTASLERAGIGMHAFVTHGIETLDRVAL